MVARRWSWCLSKRTVLPYNGACGAQKNVDGSIQEIGNVA